MNDSLSGGTVFFAFVARCFGIARNKGKLNVLTLFVSYVREEVKKEVN